MTAGTNVDRAGELDGLLAGEPPVLRIADARARIRESNTATGIRVIVLDDDPTGSQSVQGIPVLTAWSDEDLRWAFARPAPGFFILTNTRGLTEDAAAARVGEVATAIERVARGLGEKYTLISRGDSTLRGHYPLETDVLRELALGSGSGYDALLLAPAYVAAGRVTVGDVHYVLQDDGYAPVGDTNYARDSTFGFASSNLREYVQEKTGAALAASAVLSIGLDDIRLGGPERVCAVISSARDATPIVVNAVDDADLDIVVLGVLLAESRGVRLLSRTGPSFVAARLGIAGRPPLSHREIFAAGERDGHGLVIVGSHVDLTSRQVSRMRHDVTDLAVIELDVPRLLDAALRASEIARCGDLLVASLATTDAMLMSSRAEVTGSSGPASLIIAQAVSGALVSLAARAVAEVPLAWVLAKGGITSSDVATEALAIRRATVVGQLFPGIVSAWVHEGGTNEALAGLPYVVFAGNVGDEDSLALAVHLLRGDRTGVGL